MAKEKNKDDDVKNSSVEETGSSKEEQTLIDELNAQKDQYLRLQAEFMNFRRRTDEEKAKTYDFAVSEVLKGIISVFDDFELALKNAQNPDHFKKGMELIFAKLVSTSEDFGLERIQTVGKQFDPVKHEALLAEDSDRPEQEILEELQSGYMLKDAVIRTAKVKVAKKA